MVNVKGRPTYFDLPPEEFKERLLKMVEWFEKIEPNKDDPSDIRGFPSSAAAMFLARNAVSMNADFSRISLGGYMLKDKDHGDWEITVRRVTPWIRFLRRMENVIEWIKGLRAKKIYGASADDILNMDKLTSLTISIGPKK